MRRSRPEPPRSAAPRAASGWAIRSLNLRHKTIGIRTGFERRPIPVYQGMMKERLPRRRLRQSARVPAEAIAACRGDAPRPAMPTRFRRRSANVACVYAQGDRGDIAVMLVAGGLDFAASA